MNTYKISTENNTVYKIILQVFLSVRIQAHNSILLSFITYERHLRKEII